MPGARDDGGSDQADGDDLAALLAPAAGVLGDTDAALRPEPDHGSEAPPDVDSAPAQATPDEATPARRATAPRPPAAEMSPAVSTPGRVCLPVPRAEIIEPDAASAPEGELDVFADSGATVHAVVSGRFAHERHHIEATLTDNDGRSIRYSGIDPIGGLTNAAVEAGQVVGHVAPTPTGRPRVALVVSSQAGRPLSTYRLLLGAVDPLELPSTSFERTTDAPTRAPTTAAPDADTDATAPAGAPQTAPADSPPSPPPMPDDQAPSPDDTESPGGEEDAAALLFAPGVPGTGTVGGGPQ